MTSDVHHFPGLHIDINPFVPFQGHPITFFFVLQLKIRTDGMQMSNMLLNVWKSISLFIEN